MTGVILGGTASWAESNQYKLHSHESANPNPVTKTVQGMSTGLIAGLERLLVHGI